MFLTFDDPARAKAYAENRCSQAFYWRHIWFEEKSIPKFVPGADASEVGFEFKDGSIATGWVVVTVNCTRQADRFLRELGFKPSLASRFFRRRPEDLGIISYRITGEQAPTYTRPAATA